MSILPEPFPLPIKLYLDLTNGADNVTLSPGQSRGPIFAIYEVRGLDGNDTITASDDGDNINGNQGNDLIRGGAGYDDLLGGRGDDTLRGGQDRDFLSGGEGNDFLYGDFGIDTLVGGNGNDVFVLRRTDTDVFDPLYVDQIRDFNDGFDLIGLPDGITESDISLVSFTADTFIQLATTGTVLGVVLNTTPAQLAGRFTSVPD